ncbi:uncharacterized protein MELLADRAFT_89473 [Melampsora larici-populina 98AG31]|uniref:Uncharacterized protein n=1 Tax=Melampsora larici-populina (strain 98AG31 / pathotype 3-4-7) TaxID=747676 RepID=F4RTH5_MELLP|nr:uncharacterized protein MELLADRAFT_89473 [Melampsora larici-populina 98AG31]EGG04335.1 hypothetical protein MELLADRAFT_89473 [Melampsora larici-populina 98AG31]
MAASNPSSNNKVKARTLNVSGPMDVYEVLATESTASYPLRDAYSSIVCKGLSGDNPYEYQVKVSAYANESSLLEADGVYVLKSRMVAPNLEDSILTLFYEVDHAMLVTTSKDVKGSLANNTAVSGLGLIIDRFTIQEDVYDKPTLVAIVQHSDYDNAAREMIVFNVAYYVRPVRNLLAIQTLFQVNREAVISGYIVDFDANNNRFMCDVTGINLTSGPESGKASTTAIKVEDTVQTPSGRSRGKFFKKGKSTSNDKKQIESPAEEAEASGKGHKRVKKNP